MRRKKNAAASNSGADTSDMTVIENIVPQNPDDLQAAELMRRRITTETARAFRLRATRHHGRAAIVYPVLDAHGQPHARRRLKYIDGDGMKYTWLGDKNIAVPAYYNGSGFDAAAGETGTLIIASGEPDVWAWLTVGRANVVSFFGEGSIPHDLIDRCKLHNIERISYYPDRDRAGRLAAQKLHEKFYQTGIEFIAYTLPGADDSGADLGSLWASFDGSAAEFVAHLDKLPAMEFDEPAPTAPTRPTTGTPPADYAALWERYIAELGAALGIDRYKSSDGWSRKNISCPMGTHDDTNPSAGLNRQTGTLHCFACGTHSAHDVAAAVGFVSWDAFKATHGPAHPRPGRRPGRRSAAAPAPAPAAPVYGLPSTMRAALCARGMPDLARLLDTLYTVLQPGDTFDVARARRIAAGRMGENKLRDVLSEAIFQARADEAHTGRGRPRTIYTVPAPDDVRHAVLAFDVSYRHKPDVHELPSDALDSRAAYRAAVQLAHIQMHPGEHSRAALGDALGVCGSTTLRYQKRHAWRYDVTPQYDYQNLANARAALPEKTVPFAGGRWIEDSRGMTWPASCESAKYLQNDPAARLVQRRPNRYQIINPLRVLNAGRIEHGHGDLLAALTRPLNFSLNFSRLCVGSETPMGRPMQTREKITPEPLPAWPTLGTADWHAALGALLATAGG